MAAPCADCYDRISLVLAYVRELLTEGCDHIAEPPSPTTTPEDTLAEAGISNRRQARYQRRMSSLLAGRA